MGIKITSADVTWAKAEKNDIWTMGNGILYDLCREHPEHNDPKIVAAKIWLIGRAYAAAIERRLNVDVDNPIDNDSFYKDVVVPRIISSNLDTVLRGLCSLSKIDDQNIEVILSAHSNLVDLFFELTNLKKRSLASKYLHFHQPKLFYIYDSIASRGLSKVNTIRTKRKRSPGEDSDAVYASYAYKLLDIQNEIAQEFGEHLTPRQLDRILLRLGSGTRNLEYIA